MRVSSVTGTLDAIAGPRLVLPCDATTSAYRFKLRKQMLSRAEMIKVGNMKKL